MPPVERSFVSLARRAGAAIAISLLVTGCVGAAASPIPSGPGSPAPDVPATPPGTGTISGFYLRTWQTQALAPQYTFGWLPAVTITDGQFIDGRVAVPMIFPGPIYTALSERSISAAGIEAVVTEATNDGLLSGTTDWSSSMPGSMTAHIELVVDGVTHDLTGPLPTDATTTVTAPGTAAAFMAFWNRVGEINDWLSAQLGASTPYAPARLAVMVQPAASASSGIGPTQTTWPLPAPFASFGSPMGVVGYRCGVVSGADLATLLPVVQGANALTNFVDSAGAMVSIQTRVLVPDEPSPCG